MFGIAVRTIAFAAATAVAASSPARAVEERTFKFTLGFPTTHWWMSEGVQPFVDAVAEASDGKITFEIYPAAQLGKESASIVASGVADMGVLVPTYEIERLPLTSVVELPGFHKDACEGTAQFWEMAREGGPLFEQEFSRIGVRPIFGFVLNPYEVQTSEKVIESVADMKGVKLRANGAMAKAVAALGGVPVQVTAPEFYDAIARGTVDGGMWLSSSTRQYGLEDQLRHTVKGTSMGGGAAFAVISEKVYQELDEETRKILMDAAAPLSQNMCEYLDRTDAEDQAAFVAAGQLTQHKLSTEQAELWNETISSVATEWAADMDASGRPGTEILQAYRRIAEEN